MELSRGDRSLSAPLLPLCPGRSRLPDWVPPQTRGLRARSPAAATPQGRGCPGRRGGLPRAARGGEAPAAAVLGLWAAGMASSERTRCISREFGCLGGLQRRSGLSSFGEGPQWALGGPETRVCEPKGGAESEGRPRTPLLQGNGLLIAGFPTLGAPGRHEVPGFPGRFSRGASRAHPRLLIRRIPFPDPPLPPALALNPLPHPLKCLDCEAPDAPSSRLCPVSRSCHLDSLTPYLHMLLLFFLFAVTGDGYLK